MGVLNAIGNTTQELVIKDGGYIKSPAAASSFNFSVYDTTNSVYRNFFFCSAGTIPYIQIIAPTNSNLYIDNAQFGVTTPGPGTFTTLIGNTDIYSVDVTTWNPTADDFVNFTGTPTYSENTYKMIGKTVFCKCKISGLTVSANLAQTRFSITLPVSQDTNSDIPYLSNAFMYMSSGSTPNAGIVVDWDGSSANKVGCAFWPPVSGATNYIYVGMVYQTA